MDSEVLPVDDPTTWGWFYLTLVKGHEGPIVAIMILMLMGVAAMTWKGWIRFGPPGPDEKKLYVQNAEKMSDETRKHLYRGDGTTKYVPRTECIMNQDDCQGHVCEKIEEVKVLVVAANAKVDKASEERNQELRTIAKFMGGTEEFMGTVKKEISDMRAAIIMLAKDQRV
jgi:hypothetical protein